ncbi:MAG: type II toxin-antitoxin system VapC family toxin [Caldimonas sp.]
MIALDTNLLVYAHRRDASFHDEAERLVRALAQGHPAWAIPWPCVHEFYSVVTSVRAFRPASSPAQAVAQIDAWLASPSLVSIHESARHWTTLRSLLGDAQVSGGLVHDARIAAICLDHGVAELWSADRDFSRFPRLKVRNPLVASSPRR